jgi:formyl-CoA transferase
VKINAIFEKKTSAEWIDLLNAQGVACGPIYAVDEMFEDPQVKHLGIVTPMQTEGSRRAQCDAPAGVAVAHAERGRSSLA